MDKGKESVVTDSNLCGWKKRQVEWIFHGQKFMEIFFLAQTLFIYFKLKFYVISVVSFIYGGKCFVD